jgi:hypothetical protein
LREQPAGRRPHAGRARVQQAGTPSEPGDELRVGDVALTVEQTDGATITRLLVRFPQPAA